MVIFNKERNTKQNSHLLITEEPHTASFVDSPLYKQHDLELRQTRVQSLQPVSLPSAAILCREVGECTMTALFSCDKQFKNCSLLFRRLQTLCREECECISNQMLASLARLGGRHVLTTFFCLACTHTRAFILVAKIAPRLCAKPGRHLKVSSLYKMKQQGRMKFSRR